MKIRAILASIMTGVLATLVAFDKYDVLPVSDVIMTFGEGVVAFLIGYVLKSPIKEEPAKAVIG